MFGVVSTRRPEASFVIDVPQFHWPRRRGPRFPRRSFRRGETGPDCGRRRRGGARGRSRRTAAHRCSRIKDGQRTDCRTRFASASLSDGTGRLRFGDCVRRSDGRSLTPAGPLGHSTVSSSIISNRRAEVRGRIALGHETTCWSVCRDCQTSTCSRADDRHRSPSDCWSRRQAGTRMARRRAIVARRWPRPPDY